MNIIVCGGCGFLGGDKELANLPLSPQGVNVKVFDFIQLNGLSCKCCPKCNSTLIFYKSSPDFVTISNMPPGGVNIPAFTLPQPMISHPVGTVKEQPPILSNMKVAEPELIDPEILEDVLASAAVPMSQIKEEEKVKEKHKPNRAENTTARVKRKCDACDKEYSVKPGDNSFGGQCPACLKAKMKKYVGG